MVWPEPTVALIVPDTDSMPFPLTLLFRFSDGRLNVPLLIVAADSRIRELWVTEFPPKSITALPDRVREPVPKALELFKVVFPVLTVTAPLYPEFAPPREAFPLTARGVEPVSATL
jgi:hypothetical protein